MKSIINTGIGHLIWIIIALILNQSTICFGIYFVMTSVLKRYGSQECLHMGKLNLSLIISIPFPVVYDLITRISSLKRKMALTL